MAPGDELACIGAGGAYIPETNCCRCVLDKTFLDLERKTCVSSCPGPWESRTGRCGQANVCLSASSIWPAYQGESSSSFGMVLAVIMIAAGVGLGLGAVTGK